MKTSTVIFLKTLSLSLLILLFGCSPSANNADDPEQTLRISMGAEPQSLDPHIVAGSVATNILSGLVEPLATLNPSTYIAEPAAAESWTMSDDGLTYTFKLRENAKWSNGDPVVANDFVFSWQRILSPGLGHYYSKDFFTIIGAQDYYEAKTDNFDNVGVKAIDDYTLTFSLAFPDPLFLKRLSDETTAPVHPPTILKFASIDDPVSKWSRPPNFVGNGPFALTQWDINKLILLEKNPHYWDADKVKLERIKVYTVENEAAEERMFRTGLTDIMFGTRVPEEKIATYKKNSPELIHLVPIYGTYFYIFNTQKAPFNDVNLRRAFAHSVDRDQIVKRILRAGETPATKLTPQTTGYQPDYAIKYDPQLALEYLKKAGVESSEDLPNFSLTYNTSELHKKIAVTIQQMWRTQLGLEIPLENMEWKVFLESRKSHQHTIARAGSSGTTIDPINFLETLVTGHEMNDTNYSNEKFDQLIAKAKRTTNNDERLRLLEQAETMMLKEAVVIPIFNYSFSFLKQPYVKGMVFNKLGSPTFKTMYIEK